MKTKEDIIKKLEADLERMTEEERNKIFVACACGEHQFSMQSMLDAMKDPNNEDGQELLATTIRLENEFDDMEK
jgi:hypothetical protein